jgi:hypothetical protein
MDVGIKSGFMNPEKMKRRLLLKKGLKLTFGISSIIFLFPGCGNKKNNTYDLEEITDCSDLSGLDEAEVNKRKTLGYLEVTPIADNTCGNCQLYLPARQNSKCGGCQLFKGPVLENAYCTYWAPRTGTA